jgi:hypothetical protein
MRVCALNVEWKGDEKHVHARQAGNEVGAGDVAVCVVLREDWAQTPVLAGDTLNIITPGRTVDWSLPVVLDNSSGMVILQPDVLVSGTVVSESFPCLRRAVLRDTMQAGASSTAAVKGNLAHELLQSAMLTGDFRPASLEKLLRKVIADHCGEIFAVGAKLTELRQFLRALTRPMAAFHEQLFAGPPTAVQMGSTQEQVHAEQVADIEENIWSPMLGLKGKVDATLRVRLGGGAEAGARTGVGAGLQKGAVARTVRLPLEIKTGKTYINHRAQVILYTLLLGDRYPDDTVRRGLLLYVRAAVKAEMGEAKPRFDKFKGSELLGVAALEVEVRSLLLQRNQLAAFLSREPSPASSAPIAIDAITAAPAVMIDRALPNLPPLLENATRRDCEHCFELENCAILHKAQAPAAENTTDSGRALAAVEQLTQAWLPSLVPADLLYLLHWKRLVELERGESERASREVWTHTADQREKTGRCIGSLLMQRGEPSEVKTLHFNYTFARADVDSEFLKKNIIHEGDFVYLSYVQDDDGNPEPHRTMFAVANGFVQSLSATGLVVRTTTQIRLSAAMAVTVDKGKPTASVAVPDAATRSHLPKNPRAHAPPATPIAELEPVTRPWLPISYDKRVQVVTGGGMWRVDKSESVASFKRMLANIMFLFRPPPRKPNASAATPGPATPAPAVSPNAPPPLTPPSTAEDTGRRLKELIVQLRAPSFAGPEPAEPDVATCCTSHAVLLKGLGVPVNAFTGSPPLVPHAPCEPGPLLEAFAELNGEQQEAVRRALLARDYTLVLGMPGTGKTSTIVLLVRVLVALCRRVLVVSYTHSAVDNIMLKLQAHRVDMLRLGQATSTHADLRGCTLEGRLKHASSELHAKPSSDPLTALHTLVSGTMVVGSSCLGIGELRDSDYFDVCIVDEAGQVTQPVCLGPLRFARTFVLVGDHHQLPPLVRNRAAKEEGMEESLFKRLATAQPTAVVQLTVQYRMCADIQLLCNTLTYQHQMRCANELIATQQLLLPGLEAVLAKGGAPAWLRRVCEPGARVIFMDTSLAPAPDSHHEGGSVERVGGLDGGRKHGRPMFNTTEAQLVTGVVGTLLRAGLDPAGIAVLSPYRAQLRELHRALAMDANWSEKVAVTTIDKFQGIDKDVIVLSLVQSTGAQGSPGPEALAGGILKDMRRVNVALTRAKKKLILVGCFDTLKHSAAMRECLQLLARQKWIVRLPIGAHMGVGVVPVPRAMLGGADDIEADIEPVVSTPLTQDAWHTQGEVMDDNGRPDSRLQPGKRSWVGATVPAASREAFSTYKSSLSKCVVNEPTVAPPPANVKRKALEGERPNLPDAKKKGGSLSQTSIGSFFARPKG